jgi:hypothetical protein
VYYTSKIYRYLTETKSRTETPSTLLNPKIIKNQRINTLTKHPTQKPSDPTHIPRYPSSIEILAVDAIRHHTRCDYWSPGHEFCNSVNSYKDKHRQISSKEIGLPERLENEDVKSVEYNQETATYQSYISGIRLTPGAIWIVVTHSIMRCRAVLKSVDGVSSMIA